MDNFFQSYMYAYIKNIITHGTPIAEAKSFFSGHNVLK